MREKETVHFSRNKTSRQEIRPVQISIDQFLDASNLQVLKTQSCREVNAMIFPN